jgi:hypothetical protein
LITVGRLSHWAMGDLMSKLGTVKIILHQDCVWGLWWEWKEGEGMKGFCVGPWWVSNQRRRLF